MLLIWQNVSRKIYGSDAGYTRFSYTHSLREEDYVVAPDGGAVGPASDTMVL